MTEGLVDKLRITLDREWITLACVDKLRKWQNEMRKWTISGYKDNKWVQLDTLDYFCPFAKHCVQLLFGYCGYAQ